MSNRITATAARQKVWSALVEDVPVPEFGEGCTIPVRQFSGAEKTAFELSLSNSKTGEPIPLRRKQLRERLVIAYCRDENNLSVFGEEDIALIAQWPAPIVDRILTAGNRLSEFTESDIAELSGN